MTNLDEAWAAFEAAVAADAVNVTYDLVESFKLDPLRAYTIMCTVGRFERAFAFAQRFKLDASSLCIMCGDPPEDPAERVTVASATYGVHGITSTKCRAELFAWLNANRYTYQVPGGTTTPLPAPTGHCFLCHGPAQLRIQVVKSGDTVTFLFCVECDNRAWDI